MADVDAGSSSAGGRVRGRRRREPVRDDDREVRTEDGAEVLDHLAALEADVAAQEDAVRAGLLDRSRERLEARAVDVPRLEAGDLDAELRRVGLEQRGDARAVRRLVGQDVDLLQVKGVPREEDVRRT